MQVHHDSKAYIKYNLENTALMLRNNFPTSHIVVIKAVRWVSRKSNYYLQKDPNSGFYLFQNGV